MLYLSIIQYNGAFSIKVNPFQIINTPHSCRVLSAVSDAVIFYVTSVDCEVKFST